MVSRGVLDVSFQVTGSRTMPTKILFTYHGPEREWTDSESGLAQKHIVVQGSERLVDSRAVGSVLHVCEWIRCGRKQETRSKKRER